MRSSPARVRPARRASVGSSLRRGSPSPGGTTQGHLVAIADPSAWPKQGSRCSRSDVSNTDCEPNGFYLVPNPTVLLDLPLGAGPIPTEPALAGDRVFVSTRGGRVVMLKPG